MRPANPMISCDSCNGGYPISNYFTNGQCPTGWIPTGSGNPCAPVLPPPPPPMVTCQQCSGGNPIVNQFMTPNGSCPPGWSQMPNNGGPTNPCPVPPPTPNCFGNCPNPQGIYQPVGQYANLQTGQIMTSTLVCPQSHPNTQMPPCAPPQPQYGPNNYPSLIGLNATFVNNMYNGYNQFGCSFLYNRHSAIQTRLDGLRAARTNPDWQERLENKIYYITLLITQHCIMY
jgi:hypothetical protein|tara:strand:- start:1182 stop:1868 length:687 start_codon:yes stop_codon:yes gene_type:complete